MKKCTKCKEEKPLENFSKDKTAKDGMNGYCKVCSKINNQTSKKKLKNKEWRDRNGREYGKEWRKHNPSYNEEYFQKYYEKNKDELIKYVVKYQKDRRKNDPLFKLINGIRNNITLSFKRALKGAYNKKSKSIDILGCLHKDFIQHISSQFKEGMTLENYGKWELDHKIPISSAQNEEDIIRLCHYTNYQPLWIEDNRKKSNKII